MDQWAGPRRPIGRLLVITTLLPIAIWLSAPTVAGADSRPSRADLDAGLLTTADLFHGYAENDRRPLEAADLAQDDRGPCRGPNTMAHAIDLDDRVDVVTASFGTETGAALTEDVFSFTNAKQAKSFITRNVNQLKKCKRWKGLLGGQTRDFEVDSVRSLDLGSQAVQATVDVAPRTAGARGFDGGLIRQTTYVRVGSVVASLLFLRSIDFPRPKPGRGYPQSAVTALEDAL
jgi:hypothetical protein